MNSTNQTMLTPEQLQSIRERAEKATPGPWLNNDISYYVLSNWHVVTKVEHYNDVPFIARARQDIPALLAHIEQLEAMPGVRSCACREIPGLLEKIEQLEQQLRDSKLAVFDAEDWTQAFCDELVEHGIASKCNFHDRNCIQSIQSEIIGKLAILKQLEQRAERAEKACAHMNGCRNRMANAFNQFGVAGNVNNEEGMKQAAAEFWSADKEHESSNIPKLFEHVDEWKQRAELAEKAAAEMRDSILSLMTMPLEEGGPYYWCILCEAEGEDKNLKHAPNCPSVIAGQTYLSPAEVRELVKPLVDILHKAKDYVGESDPILTAGLNKGLDYAREKGLCE